MTTLPTVLGISPGDHGCGRTLTWLFRGAIEGGLKAIVLREPHLSKPAFVELARRVSPLLGQGLILHASHPDAIDIAEAAGWGLHLPQGAAIDSARTRIRGWLGVSCHSSDDLEQAEAAGADYATLSPIFRPNSKPSDLRPMFGPEGLAQAISGIEMPVFALGGVDGETANELTHTDVHGVASIGFLFPSQADSDECARNAASLCMIMKRRGN